MSKSILIKNYNFTRDTLELLMLSINGKTSSGFFCLIFFVSSCKMMANALKIFSFFSGIMGVIKPLLSLSTHVRQNADDQADLQASQSGTQTLINWFILGWFLIGSYWIYRIYEPNYDKARGLYCNKTLYTFSFWLVSSVYIGCGLICISILIISVLSIVLHKQTLRSNV